MMICDRWVFVCYTCNLRQYFGSRGECEALRYAHERCDVYTGSVTDAVW